jgi:hypothetical protein
MFLVMETTQLVMVLVPLMTLPVGSGPADADLRERVRDDHWGLHRCRQAIDCATATPGFGYVEQVERNRRIVELVAELFGAIVPAPDAAMMARRDEHLAEARSCKRPPVAAASEWGYRSAGDDPFGWRTRPPRDFFLSNPRERLFTAARASTTDPEVGALLDDWIRDLDASYAALVRQGQRDALEHADVAFDGVVAAGDGSRLGLHSPATLTVSQCHKGSVAGTEQVATSLVAVGPGSISPQPDGVTVQSGELWRIYGHRQRDGNILPCTGSHRLAKPSEGC